MNAHLEALIERSKQYATIETGTLEAGLTPDGVVAEVGARARRLFELRQQNGELLTRRVYPLLADWQSISPELEAELFEVAQSLCSYLVQSDSGLALLIYEALCEKARADGDDDRLIKYLYWRGLTMFFLNRSALGKKMLEIFGEGASYAPRYESFANKETRMYINRCVGNMYVTARSVGMHAEAEEYENQALAFWDGLKARGIDRDIQWDSYYLNLYQSSYSHTVSRYRSNPHLTPEPEIVSKALDKAAALEKIYTKITAEGIPFGGIRHEYTLLEVRYLSRQMGHKEFLTRLKSLIDSVSPDDFSHNGVYAKLNLGVFYLNYMTNGWDDAVTGRARDFIRESFAYCAGIPFEAVTSMNINLLSIFGRAGANYMDPWRYLLLLLRITTYRHVPTYAHSLMVSLMTGYLLREMARFDPFELVGLCGLRRADELPRKLEELVLTARIAGLCHDIGKIDYIHTISLYARSLTDTEFEVIRRHPSTGRDLICPDTYHTSEYKKNMDCFASVAEGHHRWYDGTGGYPDGFDVASSPYRLLIGIVSAADSIDAATDNIGRGYARGVSLQAVLSEIQEGAGTRYDPAVARLLLEPDVVRGLERLIEDNRKKAYYKAYLQRGGEGSNESIEEAMEI